MITNINYQNNFLSLEEEFENQHIQEVNVAENCNFEDYLYPNESYPENIKEHLEMSKKGIIVSTGTVRNWFDIIYSHEQVCEGIVIVDINPRAKAFVDFDTLLFRISETRTEYTTWIEEVSEAFDSGQADLIEQINTKIANGSMSQKIKDYYIKNSMAFGKIFIDADKSWKTSDLFKRSNYEENEDQFRKIKRYADAGNVISTIGNINHLLFLKSRNISVIDTSNICDYSILDLEVDDNPRVIWTEMTGNFTDYNSYIHSPLKKNDKDTLQELSRKIFPLWRDSCSYPLASNIPTWMTRVLKPLNRKDKFNQDVGAICSSGTLNALNKFVADNFLEKYSEDSHPIYMTGGNSIGQINFLYIDFLEDICKFQQIKKFIPRLVECSLYFKPLVTLAFSKIEEWKDEFESHYNSPFTSLQSFLSNLDEANVLDQFTQSFGEERLKNLMIQHGNAFLNYRKTMLNKYPKDSKGVKDDL